MSVVFSISSLNSIKFSDDGSNCLYKNYPAMTFLESGCLDLSQE